MIGGPCGGMLRIPDSSRKRGYRETQRKWRFEKGDWMPTSIYCDGQLYVRMADPLRYEWQPEPAIRPIIMRAIGRSRFWQPWIQAADLRGRPGPRL